MQILDADGNVYYNSNAESRYTDIVKFNAPSDSDAAMYYIRLISDVCKDNQCVKGNQDYNEKHLQASHCEPTASVVILIALYALIILAYRL